MNDGIDDYISTFLCVVIGFIFLVFSFYRPGEREYLLFAVGQFAGCAAHILHLMHISGGMLSVPIYEFIEAVIVAIAWTLSRYFFSILFRAPRGLWFRLSLIPAIISPAAIALFWTGWVSIPISASAYCLLVIPPTLWVLALVVRQSFRRNSDALILLAPAILAGGFYIVRNLGAAVAQFQPIDQFRWAFGIFVPVYPFHLMLSTLLNMVPGAALLYVLIRRLASGYGRSEIPTPLQIS